MKHIKQLHKWVSLLVGLQLIIWLVTGLYFNLIDHHTAGGHTYRSHAAAPDFNGDYVATTTLRLARPASEITLISLAGTPYYRVAYQQPLYRHWQGEYALFNAKTGEPASLTEQDAQRIAFAGYSGPGGVLSVKRLTPPLSELPKEENPVWQVTFDDELATTHYIRVQDGSLAGVVDDHRRLRDLAFMLHFMDYTNEGSFNNGQIILLGLLTVLLALTGLIWTVNLLREGQFSLRGFNRAHDVTLHVNGRTFSASPKAGSNLYSGLMEQGYALPSACGGGGTCGECKVKSSATLPATSADRELLTEAERSAGWRLACQHAVAKFTDVEAPAVTKVNTLPLTLKHARFLSPTIKELTFFPPDDKPLEYESGAHLRVAIPSGTHTDVLSGEAISNGMPREACYRHYSLATSEQDPNVVLNVRIHSSPGEGVPPGSGSNFLGQLQPGDTLVAQGPVEKFSLDSKQNTPQIFIGAGSGMAPLRAMIQSVLQQPSHPPVMFIYGARTEADLLYADEFSALGEAHGAFTYIPVLSQPAQDWHGERGYVQGVLSGQLTAHPQWLESSFYLCGPAAMMEAVHMMLNDAGIADDRIFEDSFAISNA